MVWKKTDKQMKRFENKGVCTASTSYSVSVSKPNPGWVGKKYLKLWQTIPNLIQFGLKKIHKQMKRFGTGTAPFIRCTKEVYHCHLDEGGIQPIFCEVGKKTHCSLLGKYVHLNYKIWVAELAHTTFCSQKNWFSSCYSYYSIQYPLLSATS